MVLVIMISCSMRQEDVVSYNVWFSGGFSCPAEQMPKNGAPPRSLKTCVITLECETVGFIKGDPVLDSISKGLEAAPSNYNIWFHVSFHWIHHEEIEVQKNEKHYLVSWRSSSKDEPIWEINSADGFRVHEETAHQKQDQQDCHGEVSRPWTMSLF